MLAAIGADEQRSLTVANISLPQGLPLQREDTCGNLLYFFLMKTVRRIKTLLKP